MKIEKLTLKNFRCYADAKITFDPKVTVLVAANGQGKTSVLDALRIAIWPFLSQFDLARTAFNDPANTIQIDDVLSVHQTDFLMSKLDVLNGMAWQLPCELSLTWTRNGLQESWTRRRESEAKNRKHWMEQVAKKSK